MIPPGGAAAGAATGYRPWRALPLRAELGRQLRRRRTVLVLGLLALLPVLLWLAFLLGPGEDGDGQNFVDLATRGGLNFTLFTVFSSTGFLLVVVVALFFGDTVASEASWSSLRYLLAAPVPRGRLLRQKAIVATALVAAGMVLLPAAALLVGSLAYGTGPLVSPLGPTTTFWQGLPRLALSMGYILVQLSWVAGLASLLGVLTDAPLGAVGGAVLLSILSNILDSITALGQLRRALPTHYAYSWSELLGAHPDYSELGNGIALSLVLASIFGALAWYRFAHKDITS